VEGGVCGGRALLPPIRMGASLPKAVETTVVERCAADGFTVGVAEMNGWRTDMEDAHLIHMQDTWGFFGVFDGHGGQACSPFAAKRLREELECNGCPKDDKAAKDLVLRIDQEFLDTEQASGSTATMCIVHRPTAESRRHRLRVINAGDSRVLLGRRDGSIVDGGGTDQGLTTDHKPENPVERERIYRCGGTVEKSDGGDARVNGDLSVSRGFGDREHKKTGGPGQEDRPVTANPEFGEFECNEDDFLLLVCDGVSEGSFPNVDVVKFVADMLREKCDPGLAARGVCHRAVETGSRDNITCMVVLLQGSSADAPKEKIEFNPGPVTNLGHQGFQKAYAAMAAKAGRSLSQAVEERYDFVQAQLETPSSEKKPWSCNPEDLGVELAKFGKPEGTKGSAERTKWFQKWVADLPDEKGASPLGDFEGKGMGKGGGKGGKGGGLDNGGTDGNAEEVERAEDGYTWSQKADEVQISFKLAKSAAKKDVKVTFKPSSISVTVHGNSMLDGTLAGRVDLDDCTWCLTNGGQELQVMLTKQDGSSSWKDLLK